MNGSRLQVWVISELYYPEETSTGHILAGIAERLAREFNVHVLCAQPTYSRRGLTAPSRENRNGVDIRRCWSSTLSKDRLGPRVINMVTITLSMLFFALLGFRPGDVAIVVTNPPLLPFAIRLAAALRQVRFVLLIHDVYPEAIVAAGAIAPRGLVFRMMSWLTSWLYRLSDRVIALGGDMRDLVLKKSPGIEASVVIISNWADLEQVSAESRGRNALLRQVRLETQFVVLYAGNLGRTHGIETLVEAADRLNDDLEIGFLFVGAGAKKKWVEEEIQRRGLSRCRVVGQLPRSAQQLFLNAGHVSVIPFVSRMLGVSVPSRMYNTLAAGTPIIAMADPRSELARVVTEESVGRVLPPDDVDALVRAIRELKADVTGLQHMSERARAVAVAQYGYEAVTERYVTLVNELAYERRS